MHRSQQAIFAAAPKPAEPEPKEGIASSAGAKAVESQMTGSLTERYDDRIAGVLSCYDRVVVTGTLPTVCYAAGMTKFLYAIGVRIFDYPQFASTLRDRVRERAASRMTALAPTTIALAARIGPP